MGKSLSGTFFIFSQIFILILGLIFIGWLYFFLNQTYSTQGAKGANFKGGPITQEPASLTLEVVSPEDNLLIFKEEVLVSGKTTPGSEILVSGDNQDMVITTKADGNFSLDFPLELGVNNITVAVFNELGETRTVSKIVYYSKEKL